MLTKLFDTMKMEQSLIHSSLIGLLGGFLYVFTNNVLQGRYIELCAANSEVSNMLTEPDVSWCSLNDVLYLIEIRMHQR